MLSKKKFSGSLEILKIKEILEYSKDIKQKNRKQKNWRYYGKIQECKSVEKFEKGVQLIISDLCIKKC